MTTAAVRSLSWVMVLIVSLVKWRLPPAPPPQMAVLLRTFLILKLIAEPVICGFVLNTNGTEGKSLGQVNSQSLCIHYLPT